MAGGTAFYFGDIYSFTLWLLASSTVQTVSFCKVALPQMTSEAYIKMKLHISAGLLNFQKNITTN